jgi:hypothetical protein
MYVRKHLAHKRVLAHKDLSRTAHLQTCQVELLTADVVDADDEALRVRRQHLGHLVQVFGFL